MISEGVFFNDLKVEPPSSLCCHLCDMILGEDPEPTNIVSSKSKTFTVDGFVMISTVSPAST